MTLALLAWFAVASIVLVLIVVAGADAPAPPALPPVAHPRASMRLIFATVQDGRLVLDGLLDLDPPSFGAPTAWSFACPDQPLLAAATLHVLERWAEDGAPVALDLSRLECSRPSVGFSRGVVHLRLSALPRSVREQA